MRVQLTFTTLYIKQRLGDKSKLYLARKSIYIYRL